MKFQLLGTSALLGRIDGLIGALQAPSNWAVGTNVEYSVHVEFGTSRMAAQPYLRPAVDRVRSRLSQIAAGAANLGAALRLIAMAIMSEAKRLCPVDTGTLRASIRAYEI